MNNNNYICCRWRDAITDPQPDGWRGLIRNPDEGDCVWFLDFRGKCYAGDQWLDITDEPAVPRADVQAAVDRLFEAAYLADCECPTCDAIRELADALGVTPTEVTP